MKTLVRKSGLPVNLEAQLSGGYQTIAELLENEFGKLGVCFKKTKKYSRITGVYSLSGGKLIMIKPVVTRTIRDITYFMISIVPKIRQQIFAVILYDKDNYWVISREMLESKYRTTASPSLSFRDDLPNIKKAKNNFEPFSVLAHHEEESSEKKKKVLTEKTPATKVIEEESAIELLTIEFDGRPINIGQIGNKLIVTKESPEGKEIKILINI